QPLWLHQLPPAMEVVMKEVYTSLDGGGRVLPAQGARTALDMLIRKKVGDRGSFVKGLDALVAEGHITKRDRLILEAAVEAGNAAAHRGFQPEQADLLQVISIVEHLLE